MEEQLQIPIIDVSSLLNMKDVDECEETIKSMAEACRDYGFLYIKNHEVSTQVQDDVFKAMKGFFALPVDVKEEITSKGTGCYRGYLEFQGESVGYLKNGEPDWREGFYFGIDIPKDHPSRTKYPSAAADNQWPKVPEGLRDAAENYYRTLSVLAFKIMGALAVGLGLRRNFFDDKFLPYPNATVGMFHYLPHPDVVGPGDMSCGEHSDYGILTVLMQDDFGGLEICLDNGQWIPAPPIPGTFIVNLGNMLEVWTNGAYKATKHRVRKKQSDKDRLSVAFFFEPCLDTVIEPLEIKNPLITLKDRQPNPDIKIPVTYGEYIKEKYDGAFSRNS